MPEKKGRKYSRRWGVHHIDKGSADSPGQQDSIDVLDKVKKVVIRVDDSQSRVVFFTFFVVVVLSVEHHFLSDRVKPQVGSDDDSRIVQVIALNGVDRADFFDGRS